MVFYALGEKSVRWWQGARIRADQERIVSLQIASQNSTMMISEKNSE